MSWRTEKLPIRVHRDNANGILNYKNAKKKKNKNPAPKSCFFIAKYLNLKNMTIFFKVNI